MQQHVLVTGGAGYIGSHVVRQLAEAGYAVVVIDNLMNGFRQAVLGGRLVVGDTGDKSLVSRVLREHNVVTVLHFAALTVVPDSVSHPLAYYENNTSNTRNLIECCVDHGVQHFIFSSTAAVYGDLQQPYADENAPLIPINPYGRSKLMSEWTLSDTAKASDLRHVTLRYFNVAGSDLEGRIGQTTPKATHLIKVACQNAVGKRDHVAIFGTDYPTPDGTGVRDYIHVEDLADAHIRAINYLADGGDSVTLNCGYGHGYSVRQVLDVVAKVSGRSLTVVESARRPGDSAQVIAVADRVLDVLRWQPQYDDLEMIVASALHWEKKLLNQIDGWPA